MTGRISPSGPAQKIPNPFPGVNVITSNVTRFLVDSYATAPVAAEVDGQYEMLTPGTLKGMTVSIFRAGADAVSHVFTVRLNGVLVPGMTVTMTGTIIATTSANPTAITNLEIGDLISLQLVSGIIAGALPIVRSEVDIRAAA